jgi:hypothetical protein
VSIDLDELQDPHHKPDFRRANGAPLIINADGVNQRCSRPSNWGKELDDENALVNWKLDRAIEGTARDPALQARAVAVKTDDRATWKELREAAINAGRGSQAADIGTALHAMSERWEDPDDDFDPGEPYVSHLKAYSAEIERLGLVSELTECKMVNDELRAAGTADRVYRLTKGLITPDGEVLPEGTLIIGDLKTGKRLDFSKAGYTVQMAVYAASQLYDVVEDKYLPTPDINQDWGILVHLPSNEPICEAFWVNLEHGRWGAYLTQCVRQWRKDWRSGEKYLAQIEAIPHSLAEMGTEVTAAEADAEHVQWLVRMSAWAQERIDAIRHHDDAKNYLIKLWPPGVPTPKKGIDSVAGMTNLLEHLDATERKFELPFVPDPGRETGTHRSTINRTNRPEED